MTRKQDRSTIDKYEWRNRTRQFVAHRASYRCESCHAFLAMHGDVDHIVPRSECETKGIHPLDAKNLQYLCTSCHSAKTNRERWAGHTPKERKPFSMRRKVKGRAAFHTAILESIADNSQGNPTC